MRPKLPKQKSLKPEKKYQAMVNDKRPKGYKQTKSNKGKLVDLIKIFAFEAIAYYSRD